MMPGNARNKKIITFERSTNLAIFLTLIVIGLGAYTRLTDAGLGCPDWPGCYGKLTAPLHEGHIAEIQQAYPEAVIEPHKAHNEMVHRYVAGLLGLLVLTLLVKSLVMKRWRLLCSFLSALIILQALLGMWTVTLNLIPLVVVAHLLGGFLVLSLLALLRAEIFFDKHPLMPEPHLRTYLGFAYVVLGVLFTQIILGGWTSANYAALACTELPVCESGWQSRFSFTSIFHLPLGHDTYEFGVLPYEARMSIHIAHRTGAAITSVAIVTLLALCWRRSQSKTLKRMMIIIALLLGLQITLGVMNIYWHLPLANAVAHNVVAANLFVALILFIQQLHKRTNPLEVCHSISAVATPDPNS